jgi:multiple sugar transport system permease protein
MTQGGPNQSTHFYAYYIYKNAFAYRKMGEACAQAWLLFVIIFIITVCVLKAARGHIYYGDSGGNRV